MKQQVIVIFDIGKTNKKLLVFNQHFQLLKCEERSFPLAADDDGVPCDNVDQIEQWMKNSLNQLMNSDDCEPVGVNFSTYGATVVFLNEQLERVAPVYDYLKPVPSDVRDHLFQRYGGLKEFCRATASPNLDHLLNSGIQLLWFKKYKPELYKKTAVVLHFPQYLASRFTGSLCAEPTSVGCHTFLWNFDQMTYHRWIADEDFQLPEPQNNDRLTMATLESGQSVPIGPGIHDSSASLVPYLKFSDQPFVLISTGTWCISMNPFNQEPLTSDQLEKDCLCFMSIDRQPVKSARFFMGYFHNEWIKRLADHYQCEKQFFFDACLDPFLVTDPLDDQAGSFVFLKNGPQNFDTDQITPDWNLFSDPRQAYGQLLAELTYYCAQSVRLILAVPDRTRVLYVTGGFSRNPAFLHLLSVYFPDKELRSSEIDNASALGAAMVIAPGLGWKLNDFKLKQQKIIFESNINE